MKKDSILYTVLFTFLVCLAFVFPLALANELTKGRVASNARFAERSAVLAALGASPASPGEVDAAYERDVALLDAGGDAAPGLYRIGSGEGARYSMKVSGPGLWGGITAILAVDAGVGRLVGLEIVAQNETPGLGGRIAEPWFAAQFRGESIASGSIRLRQGLGGPDPDDGELDAVTGATQTSAAVERIVNGGIAAFAALRDKGVLR